MSMNGEKPTITKPPKILTSFWKMLFVFIHKSNGEKWKHISYSSKLHIVLLLLAMTSDFPGTVCYVVKPS